MEDGNAKQATATRLKQARERLFSTAADAARALGMKPVTVRAHESGQNAVTAYQLELYARRYGVSVSWLLNGGAEQEPQLVSRDQYGQAMVIETLVEDGVWLPGQYEDPLLPTRQIMAPDGNPEFAVYTDPRFPAELVQAVKVVTQRTDGPYINGTVAFVLPISVVGFRPGDHVLAYRERSEFYEYTLRRVEYRGEHDLILMPLISDASPIEDPFDLEGPITTVIIGTVIGYEARRPVPMPDLKDRKHYEAEIVSMFDRDQDPDAPQLRR